MIFCFWCFGLVRSNLSLINAFDTGLYLQILENIVRYQTWESSITGESNFLSHHFQPVILLLVPAHLVWPKAEMLFLVSALSVGFTAYLMLKLYSGRVRPLALFVLVLTFILQPTVNLRLLHSFVPEVLALPGLLIFASWLSGFPDLSQRRYYLFGFALSLWIGACKENLWLVNFWVFFAMGVSFSRCRRASFLLAGLNLVIFVFLFFWWMPSMTNMPSYYGQRYFMIAEYSELGLWGLVKSMVFNLFSMRSLNTFFGSAVLLTGGLVLLGSRRPLIGALPSLLFILMSNSSIVHSPKNHYLMLCMPFFWISVLDAWEKLQNREIHFKILRMATFAAFVFGIFSTSMTLIEFASIVAKWSPKLSLVQMDIKRVKDSLKPDQSKIIVDGTLQPLFYDIRYSLTTLAFIGNPRQLQVSDFPTITDVVTFVDVDQISDCGSVKGSVQADGGVSYDYESYRQYCDWLKNAKKTKVIYPSDVVHYTLNNI
ncbi:MAG: DUF2079 domain-containing protein [Proteobacteria bacterium]|nr:DUF2079 domain-containing protein [Pseudomonadota bacterium]